MLKKTLVFDSRPLFRFRKVILLHRTVHLYSAGESEREVKGEKKAEKHNEILLEGARGRSKDVKPCSGITVLPLQGHTLFLVLPHCAKYACIGPAVKCVKW